jgi:hypothetical protein
MSLSKKSMVGTLRVCVTLSVLALSVFCTVAQTKQSEPSPQREKPSEGSVIRGRVLYSDSRRPLRRADVILTGQDGGMSGARTVTNRSGEFLFNGVSAGKYFVLVSAPDVVTPWDRWEGDNSLAIRIALGQIESGFSEVTTDGRSSVKTEILASRGGVITGRVLSEYDEPIANTDIKLFKVDGKRLEPVNDTWFALDEDKQKFKTDSRGVYRIAGLATGEYIVRASESDEGGDPAEVADGSYANGSMLVVYYPKAFRLQDATKVNVQEGTETADVDIRISDRSVHRLSGRVFVAGRVAQDASIRLIHDEPDVIRSSLTSTQARTDSTGRWEINAVPDGVYTLSVSGFINGIVRSDSERGYLSVVPQRQSITVSGADLTDLNTELIEGSSLQGVVSIEGSAAPPERLVIALVPVEVSSQVTASPRGGSPEQPFEFEDGHQDLERAYIREGGKFSFSQLHAGLFRVRIQGLRGPLYVKSITLNGKDALRTPIKIEQGKPVEGLRIVFSANVATLSGKAVAKSDRSKPLVEATILLFPIEAERRRLTGEPLVTRTDKDGRFVIKGAPGEYFVFVFEPQKKGVSLVVPSEETLMKNAAALQKVRLQPRDDKRVVEVVGPTPGP